MKKHFFTHPFFLIILKTLFRFIRSLTLEDQLRAMQKRLAEIAAIPIQIQATLENVTKTMEKLLPVEQSPELSEEESDYGYEEIEQYDDSYRFDRKDEEDAASDRTDNDVEDQLDDTEDDAEEEAAAVSSASVSDEMCDNEPESGCVSATPGTPEDRSENVWSSWPWSEKTKLVPRRSNCHLVPRTSMIQNRIKQLNEKQVLAPYTRNEQNVGN